MYITVLAPSPLCPFFHLFPSDPAVLGSAESLFKRIDRNHDGFLDIWCGGHPA